MEYTARVEDLKETAPCGMNIRYTVDKSTDFITYTNINDRGEKRKSEACEKCSWRGICKPTYPDFKEITIETTLILSKDQMEIIEKSMKKARKQGFEGTFQEYVETLIQCRICTHLLEIAQSY